MFRIIQSPNCQSYVSTFIKSRGWNIYKWIKKMGHDRFYPIITVSFEDNHGALNTLKYMIISKLVPHLLLLVPQSWLPCLQLFSSLVPTQFQMSVKLFTLLLMRLDGRPLIPRSLLKPIWNNFKYRKTKIKLVISACNSCLSNKCCCQFKLFQNKWSHFTVLQYSKIMVINFWNVLVVPKVSTPVCNVMQHLHIDNTHLFTR